MQYWCYELCSVRLGIYIFRMMKGANETKNAFCACIHKMYIQSHIVVWQFWFSIDSTTTTTITLLLLALSYQCCYERLTFRFRIVTYTYTTLISLRIAQCTLADSVRKQLAAIRMERSGDATIYFSSPTDWFEQFGPIIKNQRTVSNCIAITQQLNT